MARAAKSRGTGKHPTFIGVDLGWYGKPSGLAAFRWDGALLELAALTRLQGQQDILAWLAEQAGTGDAVVAVDAPTIIQNACGIRPAERSLNAEFRRFDAGCHAANLGRPFAANVLAFSSALESGGFAFQPDMTPRQRGRFQIEVHPHAASIRLFDLPRIVKYKRGRRAERGLELQRFRNLILRRLARVEPAVESLKLPEVPQVGNLKPVEDQLDAVLCAYIAAHWWYWGRDGNTVFGDRDSGFIVVPQPAR
jgi:predicted RNase H-like nuclease